MPAQFAQQLAGTRIDEVETEIRPGRRLFGIQESEGQDPFALVRRLPVGQRLLSFEDTECRRFGPDQRQAVASQPGPAVGTGFAQGQTLQGGRLEGLAKRAAGWLLFVGPASSRPRGPRPAGSRPHAGHVAPGDGLSFRLPGDGQHSSALALESPNQGGVLGFPEIGFVGVAAAGGCQGAVGRQGAATDRVFVAAEAHFFLTAVRVEQAADLGLAQAAGRQQTLAVVGKGQGRDLGGQVGKVTAAASVPVPQEDGPIESAAGDDLAVGSPGQAADRTLMAVEDRQGPALARHPQTDAAVGGGTGQALPVGREGHGVHTIFVAPESKGGGPCGDVPQTNGPIIAAGGEPVAIGRESQGLDGVPMSAENAEDRSGRQTEEVDRMTLILAVDGIAAHGQSGAIGSQGGGKEHSLPSWSRG